MLAGDNVTRDGGHKIQKSVEVTDEGMSHLRMRSLGDDNLQERDRDRVLRRIVRVLRSRGLGVAHQIRRAYRVHVGDFHLENALARVPRRFYSILSQKQRHRCSN